MGSFGVGMEDNDSAMDAIGNHEKEIAACVKSGKGITPLLRMVAGLSTRDPNAQEVLGVASHLLDKGVTIPPDSIPLLQICLGQELINCGEWRSPLERADALGQFASRLYATLAKYQGHTIIRAPKTKKKRTTKGRIILAKRPGKPREKE